MVDCQAYKEAGYTAHLVIRALQAVMIALIVPTATLAVVLGCVYFSYLAGMKIVDIVVGRSSYYVLYGTTQNGNYTVSVAICVPPEQLPNEDHNATVPLPPKNWRNEQLEKYARNRLGASTGKSLKEHAVWVSKCRVREGVRCRRSIPTVLRCDSATAAALGTSKLVKQAAASYCTPRKLTQVVDATAAGFTSATVRIDLMSTTVVNLTSDSAMVCVVFMKAKRIKCRFLAWNSRAMRVKIAISIFEVDVTSYTRAD
jgi:hypothetical protein